MTYRIEPLAGHDLGAFECGNDALGEWLRRHARTATGQGVRTYVLVDEDGAVVGYFAVAPHLLDRAEAPSKLARGASRQIPAILLTKFAIVTSLQGQGLGSELLLGALGVIIDAARRAGGRVVVVDAIDDQARAFYLHHDFQPIPGHDRRLVMKLSTAAKALLIAWP